MSGATWMHAPAAQELDVFACDLDGVNQIEASAGTGKTWNICALYVRLLLEKNLSADQILVVTFTKAATAELHERIRGRLAEVQRAIETGDDGGDPFIIRLFETTLSEERGTDLEAAAKTVRRALRTFDQAAIHTIHAFCQRALQEAPFAAAMPFTFEMEADDAALRFELAADFWREQVEPVAAQHPSFAAWLVEKRASPASLDEQLARRLKKPLAQLRWGEVGELAGAAPNDMQARFDAAGEMWHAERDNIVRLLEAAQDGLSKTSHKPEFISAAIDAWRDYFAQEDCHAPPPKAALKLTAAALTKGTKKNFEPPVHPFFVVADELAAASLAAEAAQRARWLGLVQTWLDHAPHELTARKRTRRVVSFDDLLSNLHRALATHVWLADALRTRYPAALIDEFQDTDPLQFAIFNRIFAPKGPLFLVGDPKQAIYSFRAADLHTYLAARAQASARYTLAVNQRSTAPVVEACNRFFEANPQAFVLDGLDYQPVRAGERQRPPLIDTDGAGAGDFRAWMLPQGEAVLTKRDAQRAASEACAAEIVRLLRGAREGSVTIGDKPLAPGNIAVLVQTHKQGSLIKRVLSAWGVGSVELAQASVFESLDAEQIERVLAAVDTPGDLRRLRAALATDWFALDAASLWRLEHIDEAISTAGDAAPSLDAMSWVERFSRYRMLWHERGFAVMWRTLMRELRVAQRIVAGAEGERRLTNVNHLAELVQARAATQPGIAPTLRWLAAQREGAGGGEEAQLRLESDRNLVQIVTVHKSKGLEYAVVFCPFLNDGNMREPPSSGLPDAREYHDDGAAVLHYGCDEEQADLASRQATREQAAERARLIYVALTRAVYRCYVVAGTYLSARSTKESARSVLNWLVAGSGRDFDEWLARPLDEAAIYQHWRALSGGPVAIADLPSVVRREPLESPVDSGARLRARTNRRTLRDAWRMASFSSLIAAGSRAEESSAAQVANEEVRPDHDELAELSSGPNAPAFDMAVAPVAPVDLAADDILAFPRGPAAGECLHRMFELADFSDRSTWNEAIHQALRDRPAPAEPELAQRLPAMMQRLLADVVSTELVPGMTLAALDPKRRLNELEFLFSAASLDFPALRALLAGYGYPDVALEPNALRGFVKGFIDMIVEHQGRFWVIDWKSNHLGDTRDDYGAVPLEDAMAGHAYHLQALLYTVALHRYLRLRLPDYAYEKHIGGYLYLFVRGVRPDWRDDSHAAGVLAGRPDFALIVALDALMDGDTQ